MLRRLVQLYQVALFTLLVCASTLSSSAQAAYFLVRASGGRAFDLHKRTHMVIAGRGNDLGWAPQWAASAKARRLMAIYPSDQVLLVLVQESAGNERQVRQLGYNQIQRVGALLDARQLMTELVRYSQIASFHTYGHSAISEGLFLDTYPTGRDVRWYPTDREPERLLGHFTTDAMATLNGCNLGHAMATQLSKLWKIPVAGALTATHFEAMFADNRFYYAEPPTERQWQNTGACLGGCFRMRPDNVLYRGHYGSYTQGLPFYKFFCVDIPEAQCLRAMALSVPTLVSSVVLTATPTYDQYAAAVAEWLCPTSQLGSTTQNDCLAQLAQLPIQQLTDASPERFLNPFKGPAAQCNFGSCYADAKCLMPTQTLACAEKTRPTRSTTFVDEYLSYLRGYALAFTR